MKRRVAGALALLMWPALALGWSTEAETRIARKAAALAPPDLRLLILKYESDYLRGVRDAADAEAHLRHRERNATARGPLRREIDSQLEEAVKGVRERRPMRELVYQLGTLAHLIADANNPLRVGPVNFAEVESDYEHYFDRSLRKFPTVFYGLHRNLDVAAVLETTFQRSRRFSPLLEEEYSRGGRPRRSAEFDDRSTAFGIASVSYSRAVSDTVNVFYYLWREAGGDVRSAAILKKGNLLLNENVR